MLFVSSSNWLFILFLSFFHCSVFQSAYSEARSGLLGGPVHQAVVWCIIHQDNGPVLFRRTRHGVTLAPDGPLEGGGIAQRRRAGLECVSVAANHQGDLGGDEVGSLEVTVPAWREALVLADHIDRPNEEVEMVIVLLPEEIKVLGRLRVRQDAE